MPSPKPLLAITDARIEIVQRQQRTDALARMARARGGALLRSVGSENDFADDPDANDVAIGLYAKVGFTGQDELTGLVVVRERALANPALGHPGRRPSERLFLIETLMLSSAMCSWRPPVPALLGAAAATFVATIHHDPDVRTHVAFRVPASDAQAEDAAAALGARAYPPQSRSTTCSFVAGVPDGELRFLDSRAAAGATALVLDHMAGAASPSQPPAARENGRTWQRRLTVQFPRSMRHVADEMRLVAAGDVDVGWSVPVVATNDSSIGSVADAIGS